jgi:predicted nucleotidyltransferase
MEINEMLNQVIDRLKTANPYKIVLFGSQARGTANEESDIDILIIMDDFSISKNFQERLDKRVYIGNLISDLPYKYDVDFKIYSRAELKMLKKKGSFFINEVERTGKTIYEKRN